MKGFMHIVEILLIALLLFFVFTQFATIPGISDDWTRTKLDLIGKDALNILKHKNVDWFNRQELDSELSAILPGNVIYSVRLQNVMKPEIRVGCICDDSEFLKVEEMLDPGHFMMNGIDVSFELVQAGQLDEVFDLESDVVLVYGYEDFSQNSYRLRNFLDYDKGIVEIFDPSELDSVQRDIFGITSGDTSSNGLGLEFSAAALENGMEANGIYDYFTHIPLFYDGFEYLDAWSLKSGDIDVGAIGNPGTSIWLTTDDTMANTKLYTSFESGEIDLDVYLPAGSSLFVGFGEYLASLSTTETTGYDSFYDRDTYTSRGVNSTHLTEPSEWSRVKIIASQGDLILYNDGEKVAQYTGVVGHPSNITLHSIGGEAYVDNLRVTHEEERLFDNFLEPGEDTVQVYGDDKRVLLEQRGDGLPGCIINYNIEGVGKGRTAWLSHSTDHASEGYGTLVKALLVWAAGDEHRVVPGEIRSPVSSFTYDPLNKDMFQNMKVSLELGYLY